MIKKLILFIVIVFAIAWTLQNYTSFKALDLGKAYFNQVDWSVVKKVFKDINLPDFTSFWKKTPDPEKQLNVFIRDVGFVPNMNAAKKGIKVIWYNEDSKNHTVTGEGWGSEEIKPNKAFSKNFDLEGNYKYHCSLHPSETGEIIIK
jgi:plastocyanin